MFKTNDKVWVIGYDTQLTVIKSEYDGLYNLSDARWYRPEQMYTTKEAMLKARLKLEQGHLEGINKRIEDIELELRSLYVPVKIGDTVYVFDYVTYAISPVVVYEVHVSSEGICEINNLTCRFYKTEAEAKAFAIDYLNSSIERTRTRLNKLTERVKELMEQSV